MSVEIDGVNNIIKADTISEVTSANGVAIDGLTIKDGGISATTGAIVFNEASADLDFRVESNGDANMLFVDGGNNKIGIGTNSPAKLLSLKTDGGGGAIGIDIHNSGTNSADDSIITFETQGHRNYSMGIDRSASAFVIMSEADGLGTPRLTVNDDGKVGILNSSPGDFNDQGDHLVVGSGSGDTGITLYSGNGSGDSANIFFADGTSGSDAVRGGITYQHDNNQMLFRVNDVNQVFIPPEGNLSRQAAGAVSMRIGSTNAGGAFLLLDGDSNGDWNGSDYSYIAHDSAGRLEIFQDSPSGTNQIRFHTAAVERMRIDSAGRLLVGKTSSADATVGCELRENGQGTFTRSNGPGINVTRNTNDGELMKFIQDASLEGTISVSGTTVSYNGFTGSHWSRLADNSKPTILRGTIMDSIDEMCDWYQAVADVAEVNYTADDAEVIEGDKNVDDVKTEAHKIIEEIALPSDKSVGDAVTFTSNGVEYTGKYVKEGDVKHVKSKVSDTADSTKIYGVFSHWDEEGADTVNDMFVSQVGTYVIRVHKDITVAAGDLLVSNGDGTAKKQDDDIIRSKTVAKVNSNVKIETYSDGSYTVPCTLHC